MKDVNATCDCCKRRWVVQMQQSGKQFHLCSTHHDELQSRRTADKNGQAATKWAEQVAKNRKEYVAPPIIAVPA